MAVDAAVSAEVEKRGADAAADGEPAAKAAKVDMPLKSEGDAEKEKKEKKEKKEGKEDKDKKDKKEKKEKKEGKEGKDVADKVKDVKTMDQRQLFKDGQKGVTPPVSDPTRGFYESLLAENPESKIAIRFCIEYGVLANEEHVKLLKKYNHLKDKGAFSSVSAQLKKALEKKAKFGKSGKDKDKKDKKEKKEKKAKDEVVGS